MASIVFECDTTNYYVIPNRDNFINTFAIQHNAIVISFMNEDNDNVIAQSEISKEDAIELAKLIFLKYVK